jgi:hypothetical protein
MVSERNTGTKLIIFTVSGNTVAGDAELLRTAADWLEKNFDYTLVDLTYHEIGTDGQEYSELRLYYDS